MSDSTEPKVDATVKPAEGEEKPITSSSVFSMFGGGAEKEKKDDEEDRGDNSGSAKAQRDAAAAAKGDDEVSTATPATFYMHEIFLGSLLRNTSKLTCSL